MRLAAAASLLGLLLLAAPTQAGALVQVTVANIPVAVGENPLSEGDFVDVAVSSFQECDRGDVVDVSVFVTESCDDGDTLDLSVRTVECTDTQDEVDVHVQNEECTNAGDGTRLGI